MLAVVQRPPHRAVLGVLGGCFLLLFAATPAHALLLDLIPGSAPATWPYGIVPANVPVASGASPNLPPQLDHRTFFNWSVSQNAPAGTWRDEFWIDGVLTQMVTRTGAPTSYDLEQPLFLEPYYWLQVNTGPIYIPGGRHTLEIHTDPDGTSGEDWGNELNNTYRRSYVWTPTPITPATSTETVPPQGNFNAPMPNCNAYAFTPATGTAWVASMAALGPGAQAAFLVYDDFTNSTTGLQHEIARSIPVGIETRFVVGSPNSISTIYPSCARMPGSPGVFVSMAVADAAGRRAESGTANWPSTNMPKLTAAQVFEAHLTEGVAEALTMTRFMGEDDLELRVFGPGTTIANQSQAQWFSIPRGGDDEYDDLVFTPPVTGTYLIVVARVNASHLDTAMGYALALTPTGTVDTPVTFFEVPLRAAPSPARGPIRLSFVLAHAEPATLDLYDVRGRAVRRLADGPFDAGPVVITWDGRDNDGLTVSPGRYFVRLVAGSRRENLSIVRVR